MRGFPSLAAAAVVFVRAGGELVGEGGESEGEGAEDGAEDCHFECWVGIESVEE